MNVETVQRRILTVFELTTQIKSLLEDNFPFVWVVGEISNFKAPMSGHFYFTLKDQKAQINAVMFRGQNRSLKFGLEDGMSVVGLGRVSVFEPRGTYQVILEYLEPAGAGALQLAFEQLKARLSAEGLFAPEHKRSLPFLPEKIAIVTSPTGAVVHDIIKIIARRFPNLAIEILPVKVQGDEAEKQIVAALELLNARSDADVIIVARGGGSMEDLHAFNTETVARAVFASNIPVISAIGHETDFSIVDFVADLRAPTPSAAAELVVPLKRDLVRRCHELSMALSSKTFKILEQYRSNIKGLTRRLGDPRRRIQDFRLRVDDLGGRLHRAVKGHVSTCRERLKNNALRLRSGSPLNQTRKYNEKVENITNNLLTFIRIRIDKNRFLVRELDAKLRTLSPAAVLDRGYSITTTIPEKMVVRDPNNVSLGQNLEVRVAKGALFCEVKGK